MSTAPRLSSADLAAAARRLGASLADRSAAIESNRTLPPDVVDDLRDAGLFRLFVPGELGGPELGVQEAMDVIEEIAVHDGAAAWCVMIAATTGLLAAYLPEPHAEAVYGDPGAITGGFAAPLGRARATDGGLLVSGRWQWGSGTRHCTSIGGGCLLVDASGAPVRRDDGLVAPFVFFEPNDVELLDTWYVSGLRGTGSTDYQVEGAFVPEGRWVQIGLDRPRRGGPLYRFSFYGLLALGITSVALGVARRAIEELLALAGHKRPQGSSRPLAERAPVQADVAAAEAIVRSSAAYVADSIGVAWNVVLAGNELTDGHRRSLRLAATHGTQEAARAVDLMYAAAGGAAVYDNSPIQRVFRDVHVATQHAMVAPRTFELTGRLLLGLDTDTRQL